MYYYIFSVPKIREDHILQLLLMGSNCLPCCGFVCAEVRNDGRKCGHELIGSRCKAKLSFEIGAGVKVVTQRAKSLLGGPRGVENRYMGTIYLIKTSASGLLRESAISEPVVIRTLYHEKA